MYSTVFWRIFEKIPLVFADFHFLSNFLLVINNQILFLWKPVYVSGYCMFFVWHVSQISCCIFVSFLKKCRKGIYVRHVMCVITKDVLVENFQFSLGKIAGSGNKISSVGVCIRLGIWKRMRQVASDYPPVIQRAIPRTLENHFYFCFGWNEHAFDIWAYVRGSYNDCSALFSKKYFSSRGWLIPTVKRIKCSYKFRNH